MPLRRSGRNALVKYFIVALVGAALYSEWIVYYTQPSSWENLKCQEGEICTKILFIADPQIQGDMAVPWPLYHLFNWDSDRYVKTTFTQAIKHFKPDVLVYLGDLMDEGSIATMKQFHHYAKRLLNIFELDYPVVQVWVPGDNDIGGEGESVKKDKVEEFENIFEQPSVITSRNISFYKVNAITSTYPKLEDNNSTNSNYKIVVSHYPVTTRQYFGHKVNDEIHPNIYFCAHEHESKYVWRDTNLNHKKTSKMTGKWTLNVLSLEPSIYEVYVPTCSYRMGTSNIGFGAALLENNNQLLRYTVFWSPQRFPYLFLYLAFLTVAILYCLVFCATRLFHKYGMSTYLERSSSKLSLLEKI